MKLFKNQFFMGLIMTVPFVASCSNDDVQVSEKSETITITADIPNQDVTRVDFDKNNYALSWKAGDAFQVYSATAAGNTFSYTGVNNEFSGTEPASTGDLFAFYPASKSLNTGKDNDLFDYTGQTQQGSDNVDDLSNYLYMTGMVDPVDYTVSDFALQPAVLKLTINMPATFVGEVASLEVGLANGKFYSKKHVQDAQDMEADKVSSMSMTLSGISFAASDTKQFVVYMAVSPINVVNDSFTLTVTDVSGVQYATTVRQFTYDFAQAKVCRAVMTVEQEGETDAEFISTDYSSDQPLDKTTAWIGYKSKIIYIDGAPYVGLDDILQVGNDTKLGKFKVDVTLGTNEMRFFAIPADGKAPQVVVTLRKTVDGATVDEFLVVKGEEYIKLPAGDATSNTCLKADKTIANWDTFTPIEGENMFIVNVTGYERVLIGGDTAFETTPGETAFGVFGIQFK